MIGRRQRQAALCALAIAWRNFGNRRFRVDRAGTHWRPLKDAESMGWVWFDGDLCGILPAGAVEAQPYVAARVAVPEGEPVP